MNTERPIGPVSRRNLLQLIGATAGGAAMYHAMASLGHASASTYRGTAALQGAPHGTSVIVLGAGIAGMVAAYELRNAGYRVQVLEYNARAGGRNWTLRKGDQYTELGGATQRCEFDEGLYLNPGPWRIPYHHQGILSYIRKLGIPLEPFVQVNYNAYLHHSTAFGGVPQRYRAMRADFNGHVAELMAKAMQANQLDTSVTREDQEKLLEALRAWGALDKDYAYRAGEGSSSRRGYDKGPGGGLTAKPTYSVPVGLSDILNASFWKNIATGDIFDVQTTMFQPVGGMGRIGEAFGRELHPLIHYNAKVTEILQDSNGVTVTYTDREGGDVHRNASADWCVCTIPLSILSQIPMNVGSPMTSAIRSVPYAASVKVGLQFKRRFWEEDEQIYGGITSTDLPISTIGYPNCNYQSSGKGVLLGAYAFGVNAMEFTAMAPSDRITQALAYGSQIHPQYAKEYDNGISVAWHRSPFTLGCFGLWTAATREQHYDNLCEIDGRIVLAGDHASYFTAWQEGAVTSALDAIGRLHGRVLAQGGKA